MKIIVTSVFVDDQEKALQFYTRILGFVNAPALMQRLVAPLQRNSVHVRDYEEKRDLFYNALTSFGYQVVNLFENILKAFLCPLRN